MRFSYSVIQIVLNVRHHAYFFKQLARLSHILQSMSEATRLEHLIERRDKQPIELVDFFKELSRQLYSQGTSTKNH